MVEVNITDTSSAEYGGFVITGPAHFHAAEITVGDDTYTEGYILVNGGIGLKTLDYPQMSAQLIPFFICLCVLMGLKFASSLVRAL